MTTGSGAPSAVRAEGRMSAGQRRSLAAAVLGWTVDMYDLLVILHVATYVSAAFFPSGAGSLLGLTATYAAFAVSLVVRPIGALLFGSFADRAGRRPAMTVAVLGAGAATAVMGVLPGIATIGIAAPVLLIVLRVVQGLFVGGITASTHTLATETLPERWRGMAAGLIKGGGASLAVVVINLVVLGMVAAQGQEAFAAWGWRVLFVAALLGSVVNYVVLLRVEESPSWIASHRAGTVTSRPVRVLFSARWRALTATTVAIVFTASAPYYLTTGILPTVYKQVMGLGQSAASAFLIINVVLSAAVAVACGHLSQRIGRRPVFVAAGVACLVLVPGLYLIMLTGPPAWVLLVCGAVMVMASGAISAPLIIFVNELFPTDLRSTATAFSWNVGYGLSGMLPTFVTGVSGGTSGIVPVLVGTSAVLAVGFLLLMVRARETRGALDVA